jgi:hypothetical protein
MIKGIGKLVYTEKPYKLIVEVENDLGNYYRSFIPKYFRFQKPMYNTHISVIRSEDIYNLQYWGELNNVEIEFDYDNYIFQNSIYFWLAVECNLLKNIRENLGLPPLSKITKSPCGNHDFHITIANSKF